MISLQSITKSDIRRETIRIAFKETETATRCECKMCKK